MRDERGVSMVEFGFIALPLCVIMMGGLELGAYCKQHFPGLPFVLMSGGSRELQNHDGDKYLQSGVELSGARCVLHKPFSLSEFLQVIESCLQGGEI